MLRLELSVLQFVEVRLVKVGYLRIRQWVEEPFLCGLDANHFTRLLYCYVYAPVLCAFNLSCARADASARCEVK